MASICTFFPSLCNLKGAGEKCVARGGTEDYESETFCIAITKKYFSSFTAREITELILRILQIS